VRLGAEQDVVGHTNKPESERCGERHYDLAERTRGQRCGKGHGRQNARRALFKGKPATANRRRIATSDAVILLGGLPGSGGAKIVGGCGGVGHAELLVRIGIDSIYNRFIL
jgi:hypothetical protein